MGFILRMTTWPRQCFEAAGSCLFSHPSFPLYDFFFLCGHSQATFSLTSSGPAQPLEIESPPLCPTILVSSSLLFLLFNGFPLIRALYSLVFFDTISPIRKSFRQTSLVLFFFFRDFLPFFVPLLPLLTFRYRFSSDSFLMIMVPNPLSCRGTFPPPFFTSLMVRFFPPAWKSFPHDFSFSDWWP